MGAGITQKWPSDSLPWQNATQGQVGFGVSMSADEKCNLATTNAHVPHGILINSPKQNEFAAIWIASGAIVEAVCGAAITAAYPTLVAVTVDGTGRFITAVKTATPGTVKYVWGFALKSTTAAGQKFPLRFLPHEMDIT